MPAVGTRPDLEALVRAGLARAADDVARAERTARAFDLEELTAVELPPVAGTPDAARALHELAPLYFVAELERAGLLAAAEEVAARAHVGDLRGDLRAVEGPLTTLWRQRHRHFSGEERRALFRRLFGSPGGADLGDGAVNHSFEVLLGRLADAVIGQEDPGRPTGIGDRVRLREAGRQLAATATGYGGGVPRLASRDLVGQVRTSLAVLGDRGVQQALGVADVWAAVRRLLPPEVPPEAIVTHARRAQSGALLLSWLADNLPDPTSAGAPPDEVVGAAFEWLDATLSGALAP